MSVAVRLEGLRKVFGTRAVLDGVDLEIRRGEFVALLGASGTGKTTLLRILGGLDRPDGGTVLVPERRTIVFQEPRLVPSKRALGNVTVGLPRGAGTRERGERALTEVGLAGHAAAWPHTLSGGEAQRVALARALVREPELLLLDEPFAALDALTRLRMQDLVGELVTAHRPAVLLVTHDVDEAVRLADRVAVLSGGHLITDETVTTPQPRDPTAPGFTTLRRRLLTDLGVHPPVRDDAVRDDAVRDDAVRDDAVQEDAVRADAVRADAVRADAVRAGAAQEDAAREDAVRADAVREDAVRADVARAGAVREDAVRGGGAGEDAVRGDGEVRAEEGVLR